ncbi:MAG TPA: DUF3300 domain-containing protein [Stellaceae bacterium]|nr:DUF3300 domain-containing protein [Stellaceae bacterium]
MFIRVFAVIVSLISLIGFDPRIAAAAQPAPSLPPLTAAQLDRLVAPIALYPDPLLAQILMAATYPLEVVEADRWLQVATNAALKGKELTTALRRQPWDPSIKSLIAFPRVLRMMDDNLDWTEQLGDAFLAQQADVMAAVQHLRRLAEAARVLAPGPQQTVSPPGPEIAIEPANPEAVYIPAYNPWCVYGAWPDPAYPPFVFGTWPEYCGPQPLIFGAGIYPPFGFWAWGIFEWRRHRIRIDDARFAQFHAGPAPAAAVWQHDPAHRDGVPYPNSATAARYLGAAAAARREFRGFAPTPGASPRAGSSAPAAGARHPGVIRGGDGTEPSLPPPPTLPPAPTFRAPIFQSFGSSGAQVSGEAARGFSSRMSAPAPSFHAAPMPTFNAAPAPAFHAAPAPSFGGGGHR